MLNLQNIELNYKEMKLQRERENIENSIKRLRKSIERLFEIVLFECVYKRCGEGRDDVYFEIFL
jgi:hypothetical protein